MSVLDRLRLDGKVALVTGGGSGLGQAIALAMADAGADIAVSGRRLEPLQETQRIVEAKGRRCLLTQADVTDSAQVNRMVAEVIAGLGRLDILVNNAGGGGAGAGKTMTEFTDEDWHEGINANLTSAFFCSRAVVNHFAERGSGRVINISSGQGYRGGRNNFMYAVAKGGMIQLTKTYAMTFARNGIRSTCIAPGWFPHFMDPDQPSSRLELQAAGRIGLTYEIGPLAVFLASEAADYMSGETVLIDGGAIAGGILPATIVPVAEG
ncbi:MAG: SDR family oxidoreductase [Chloroflexi bacterium]|nr:MAG: SDR family oxidoreductase [Chloroflexota bacterium]